MRSKGIYFPLSGLVLLALAGCEIDPPVVNAPVVTNGSVGTLADTSNIKEATISPINVTGKDAKTQSGSTIDASQQLEAASSEDTSSTILDNSQPQTSPAIEPAVDKSSLSGPIDTASVLSNPSNTDVESESNIDGIAPDDAHQLTASDTMDAHGSEIGGGLQKTENAIDHTNNMSDSTDQTGQNSEDNRLEVASVVRDLDLPKLTPKAEPVRIVPKKPTPPPPPPLLQPASLIGLTNKSLIAEIGEADFIRLEGQMQIWQYKTDACVTDFFLYPADDVSTNPAYFVTDWYSRPSLFGGILEPQLCYEALARRQTF